MSGQLETFTLHWEGLTIEVRYQPNWLGNSSDYRVAHFDITTLAPERHPLPFTETGYKSHFLHPEIVEQAGGPESFVRVWLEDAAQSVWWKQTMADRRQLSLF